MRTLNQLHIQIQNRFTRSRPGCVHMGSLVSWLMTSLLWVSLIDEEGKVGRNLIFVQLSALSAHPELIRNQFVLLNCVTYAAVRLNPLWASTIIAYAASICYTPSSIFWMLS